MNTIPFDEITIEQNKIDIINKIADISRRISICKTLRYIVAFALSGIVVSMAITLISRFTPLPFSPDLVVIAVVALSSGSGIVTGILKRASLLQAAIAADTKLDMKDRLGSAFELISKRTQLSQMSELQLEDTAEQTRFLDPKAICPQILPKAARVIPLAAIVLIALFFIPPYYDEPAEVKEAIKAAGAEIHKSAKDIISNPEYHELSSQVSELVKKTETTGKELEKPISKKEALRKISGISQKAEAMKDIAELSEELKGKTPEQKRLLREIIERLADSLKDIPELSEIRKEIMKAQQADLSEESLRKLAEALDKKRMTASDIASLQQISEKLAQAKQMLQDINAKADNMEEANRNSGEANSSSPGKDSSGDTEEATQGMKTIDEGYRDELDGQISENGKTVAADIAAEPEKGASFIPYQDMYVKYRNAAVDAVSNPSIPVIYRDQVKKYFDAIKPEQKK